MADKTSAAPPRGRPKGRAQTLQPFDKITIMSEQPATTEGYVPRGTPKKGLSGETSDGARKAADGSAPRQLSAYDDTDNKRADQLTMTRATPASQKGEKSVKPKYLRTYTDMEGENIP